MILDDNNIDWSGIRSGNKEAVQYALDCAEPLWKWVLDREAIGWRQDTWDSQDIAQDMRLRLLLAMPNFDCENGHWSSYVAGIARNHAASIRSRRRWPGAETERKASWCDQKFANDSGHGFCGMGMAPTSLDMPFVSGTEDEEFTLGATLLDEHQWQMDIETRFDFLNVLEAAHLTDCEYAVFTYRVLWDIPCVQCEELLDLSYRQIDNALQRAKRKLRKAWLHDIDGYRAYAS